MPVSLNLMTLCLSLSAFPASSVFLPCHRPLSTAALVTHRCCSLPGQTMLLYYSGNSMSHFSRGILGAQSCAWCSVPCLTKAEEAAGASTGFCLLVLSSERHSAHAYLHTHGHSHTTAFQLHKYTQLCCPLKIHSIGTERWLSG